MGGNYRKVLRPILRAAKVGMKPPILSAMAKLMRKLLTKVESPAAHVAHLVTDIVHGYVPRVLQHMQALRLRS